MALLENINPQVYKIYELLSVFPSYGSRMWGHVGKLGGDP